MEMIDRSYSPASWLATYAKIELSGILDAGLKVLNQSKASKLKWEEDLNLLLAACRAAREPLEKAHALLLISEAAVRRNDLERARGLLVEGLSLCKEKSETQAILEWILGSVEWWARSGISAYKHWTNARDTLDLLNKDAVKNHQDDKAIWCKETSAKLDNLVVEMTGSVKGGFLIFNRYTKSKLCKITYDLVQLMKEHLAAKRDVEVEKVMKLLEANTRFSDEYPEVMVECGVAYYELGDVAKAVRHFQVAQRGYLAEKENRFAVIWMLAVAQGYLKGQEMEALQNWRECEKLLKELTSAIDRMKDEDRQEKKQWFEVLTALLNKLPG